MTVSVESAATFAKANQADAFVAVLFSAVKSRVADHLGHSGQNRCPEDIQDLAVLLVFRRAWEIYKSSNGVVQYEVNGETSFLPADILKPAIPLLKPYKAIGAVG